MWAVALYPTRKGNTCPLSPTCPPYYVAKCLPSYFPATTQERALQPHSKMRHHNTRNSTHLLSEWFSRFLVARAAPVILVDCPTRHFTSILSWTSATSTDVLVTVTCIPWAGSVCDDVDETTNAEERTTSHQESSHTTIYVHEALQLSEKKRGLTAIWATILNQMKDRSKLTPPIKVTLK